LVGKKVKENETVVLLPQILRKKSPYTHLYFIRFNVPFLKTIPFLFFWMTAGFLFATEPATPAFSIQADKVDLTKRLQLTSEQDIALKALQWEYDQKDSLRMAHSRTQKTQIRKDRTQAIRSLLNKEQLEQYNQLLIEQENQRDIRQQIRAQAELGNEDTSKQPGFPGGPMPDFGLMGNPGQMPGNMGPNGPGQPNDSGAPGMGGPMGGPGEMRGMPMGGGPFSSQQIDKKDTKTSQSKSKARRKEALLQTIRLTKALDLNETQALRINQIQLDYLEKMAEKKGDKEAINKLQVKKRKSIRAMLNSKQRTIYDALLERAPKKSTSKSRTDVTKPVQKRLQ
jgi:hypothetical protein